MRGQAFVTFPSIGLAQRALVCICMKLDVVVAMQFLLSYCFFYFSLIIKCFSCKHYTFSYK